MGKRRAEKGAFYTGSRRLAAGGGARRRFHDWRHAPPPPTPQKHRLSFVPPPHLRAHDELVKVSVRVLEDEVQVAAGAVVGGHHVESRIMHLWERRRRMDISR